MPPNGQMYASNMYPAYGINAMPSMDKMHAAMQYEQQIKFMTPNVQAHQRMFEQSPPSMRLVNRFSNQAPVEFVPFSHSTNVPAVQVSAPPRTQSPVAACAEEAEVAAKWWASKMRQNDLSQTEVNAFEQALRYGIIRRCEGRWYPAEPMRGSAFRSIINDLTTDPLLVEAANAVRIRDIRSRLPQAVLWINPASVRVKVDEERFTQDIFGGSSDKKPTPASIPEASSDEEL